MKTYLNGKHGKATTCKTSDEFKKACKKGIVLFAIPFADATGHLDLWDGSKTIDGHDDYIKQATEILLWPLED